MIAYLTIFVLAAYMAHRIQTLKDRPDSVLRLRVLLFILFAMLSCFIGLRYGVGTDYYNYRQSYFNRIDLSWKETFNLSDPALYVLAKLGSYIWNDPVMMFMIAAVIFFALYIPTIYKYSNNFYTAIVMFIISGTMLDSCNGVRQSLAMAIIFSGYGFLRDRKFVKYTLLILLASTFHSTAIIMLPVYFLLSKNVSWWRFLIIIVASVALSYSYDYIFEMVETVTEKTVSLEYSYYAQSVNVFRVAVAVAPCCLIPLIGKEGLEKCGMSVNCVIFNAALMCITANSAFLARIGIYSTGFLCIALPDLLDHLRIRNAFVLKTVVYVCYFAYWIASIFLTANLYPYRSIFSR